MLISLGMPNAFDVEAANFSMMAVSANGNIYISDVIHKTFISVDELGTRAGAVTMVAGDGAGAPHEPKVVTLDRPFLFAIIENATNLPIFIGTLKTV